MALRAEFAPPQGGAFFVGEPSQSSLRDASSPEGGAFCALSPAGHGTILNSLRCALAMFSGKYIFKFAMLENLRIFQHCLFTGGAQR